MAEQTANNLEPNISKKKSGFAQWVKLCFWIFGSIVALGVVGQGVASMKNYSPSAPARSMLESEQTSRGFSSKSLQLPGISLSESMPGDNADNLSRLLDQWSPFLIKLGLSFFVGFSIGVFLKAVFKVSLFLSGMAFLLLFALSYFNVVEIHWDVMEGHYNSIIASLGEQTSVFKNFITGSLPSAGSFSFGVLAALKRR